MTGFLQELPFRIIFHARFRVGAAYPLDGLDTVVDTREPLPADHLKGLMRAEARTLLGASLRSEPPLIRTAFGGTGAPSPWSWLSAEPSTRWTLDVVRQRVAIDNETHTACQDHLVSGSLAWAQMATFRVVQVTPHDDADTQAALLRLAGRGIHHLGAWRRRGLGWVGVGVVGDPAGPAELAAAVGADLYLLRHTLPDGVVS